MRSFVALLSLLFCVGALAADPQVELKTNLGTITLELYPDKAPKTVENFLQYVKEGFYKSTVFHRVISGFMIQGGGFSVDFVQKKTRPPVQNEANNGLKNGVGTIAMARTRDPHSATAQFYINVKDNPFLDENKYCAFGKVIEGMEVVDRIKEVETGRKGMFTKDCPKEDVVIKKAKRADK